MHDVIQQGLQALAAQNTATRDITIFCAVVLVYLLCVAWALVVIRQRASITVATGARIIALGVLAYLLSKLLTHVIVDPRPYIVNHTRPLIPVARDNGFPSDHTLLAAFLAASLWWINRRLLVAFAVGTLLVLLARLGVGAHHTVDVLGSVAIAAVAAVIVAFLRLPAAWDGRPLLGRWGTIPPASAGSSHMLDRGQSPAAHDPAIPHRSPVDEGEGRARAGGRRDG